MIEFNGTRAMKFNPVDWQPLADAWKALLIPALTDVIWQFISTQRLAYDIYQKRTKLDIPGSALDDWLQAEQESKK